MKGHTLSAFLKLVAFAVVTIVATAILGVTISNRTFGPTRTYSATFTDATDLLPGDSVRAAGVRVGTVKSVEVTRDRYAKVTFDVDTNVPVTTTTHLQLRYLNLVGQRYLALVEHPGSGTPLAAGADIPLARTAPALDLTALFNGFRPLFQGLSPKDTNAFASEIVATLQGERSTVADLTERSASLTNRIADRDAVIGDVIDNLLTVLDTVQKRDQGLNELVVELQRLVSGLASDRGTIAASLSHIDDLAANSAELLREIRPYLPSDLSHLAGLAKNLNTTKNCSNYLYPVATPEVDATKVPRFANNNCKGPNTLAEYLNRAPTKLIQIIRTATYGSFFNFYLCDMELGGSLASKLPSTSVHDNSAACAS